MSDPAVVLGALALAAASAAGVAVAWSRLLSAFSRTRSEREWVLACPPDESKSGATPLSTKLGRPGGIMIVGSTSSGKSTLAAELVRRTGRVHIELDNLYHKPGWKASTTEEFQEKVNTILAKAEGKGFVSCGSYWDVRTILCHKATLIIWLDYDLVVNFTRLSRRTFRRWWYNERVCGGNTESLWNHFNILKRKDSLFYWLLSNHHHRRGVWCNAFSSKPPFFPSKSHRPNRYDIKLPHHVILRLRSPAETSELLERYLPAAKNCSLTSE